FEAGVEAGAEDVVSREEGHEIVTEPEALGGVRDSLEAKFGPAQQAKLVWRATNSIPIADDPARTLFELIEALEDSDDVQAVHANYDVADDVLQRLAAAS
ncbi:MAG: YebC/PmpR family DNA-binding transcriptional regulator, partial [Alphaproteobacteria bacterium]|nr:YebC/PmpR family DNA-binding transcriptional regulator [Alphaproteobacteria bacterium]